MDKLFTLKFTTYPELGNTFSWWGGFTTTTYDEMVLMLSRPEMLAMIEEFRITHASEVIDIQIVELAIKGSVDFAY